MKIKNNLEYVGNRIATHYYCATVSCSSLKPTPNMKMPLELYGPTSRVKILTSSHVTSNF